MSTTAVLLPLNLNTSISLSFLSLVEARLTKSAIIDTRAFSDDTNPS